MDVSDSIFQSNGIKCNLGRVASPPCGSLPCRGLDGVAKLRPRRPRLALACLKMPETTVCFRKPNSMTKHQKIDSRSRALAIAVADELRRQPVLVDVARKNIAAWMKTSSSGVRSTLEEWDDALKGSTEQVLELLTGEGERAVRLRQSNPFAGVLSSKQRTEILNRFLDRERLLPAGP